MGLSGGGFTGPRKERFTLSAGRRAIHRIPKEEPPVTKAQEIHERADALMAEGKTRPGAFKQLATELGIKLDSVRGAYYTAVKASGEGRTSRPRRRETTPGGRSGRCSGSPGTGAWGDRPRGRGRREPRQGSQGRS